MIDGLISAHDLSSNEEVTVHIEQVLGRSGVEPMVIPPGTKFDPNTHKAVEMEATDDPARNRIISATIRPGWRRGANVLRDPEVKVWRHMTGIRERG